ncbi:hypothetical protein GCM10020216_108540 [Nonomuraea helvata]
MTESQSGLLLRRRGSGRVFRAVFCHYVGSCHAKKTYLPVGKSTCRPAGKQLAARHLRLFEDVGGGELSVLARRPAESQAGPVWSGVGVGEPVALAWGSVLDLDGDAVHAGRPALAGI